MKKILISILAILSVAAAALAQTSVKVDAPGVVGLDEQFNLTFVVDGDKKPSDFDWSPGSDFRLVWGPQQGSSHSVSIVNGKRTSTSQYTFTYILQPTAAGTFTIPAASATVGGKKISSGTTTIKVVSNGAQAGSGSNSSSTSGSSGSVAATGDIASGDLFMRLNLSSSKAVVGQPLTATLKLYQRVDIAGFEDARFPSFNGFWSKETSAPTNIQFQRESYNDKIYNTAVIRSYVIIPQQAGDLRIDPAELVCLVSIRSGSRTGSIFDDFFDDGYSTVRKRITTPATTVHVSALPSGAPASFGGGVGKFSISASLSKDTMKTNDAASLTVTVSGRGNVSLLEAPSVKLHPDMETYDVKTTDNSDASTGGTTGSKTFEYPFIPRSNGDFTIPEIEYSYYDTEAGKYVTLKTQSIDYHVDKGEGGAGSVPSAGVPQVDRKGVRNLGEDIRFIETDTPSFTSAPSFLVGKAIYWILILLMGLGAAAVWFLERRNAAIKADVAGTRNRKASRMALGKLRKAKEYLDKNLYSAFYEELHTALLGFVSDKLNMGMEELNHDTIAERLSGSGVDKTLIDKYMELLDACEFARYSPSGDSSAMADHYDKTASIISSMDQSMKTRKSSGAGKAAAMALILLLTFPSPSHASDNPWADSLWTAGTEAYNAGRWQDAASSWNSIVSAGMENAELYYNTGNAFFKAGDYPHAILNYEKALKLDPSFSDARYNLEFANGQIQDKIDAVPEFILVTWYKKASYLFASNTWAVLSLIFFAGTMALLLLLLLGYGARSRRIGFFGGIAALLIAVLCFAFSRTQYSDWQNAGSAIVTVPVSSVVSSPSRESAKDLFVLHGGTKVTILDNVGEWAEIRLADGREGWMPSSDFDVI